MEKDFGAMDLDALTDFDGVWELDDDAPELRQLAPVTLTYEDKSYDCRPGESVLEASLRKGIDLHFSCLNGICQACLHRAVDGPLPQGAQKGLKASLAAKNYFLACVCRPEQNLEFAPPKDDDLYFTALVAAKEQLAGDIFRISLEPSLEVEYRSGQFLNLRRADGTRRSYSLASVPGEDYLLELHVKRVADGVMSNWLIDELDVGAEIEIQGPNGTCFHDPVDLEQNLLLVGTGSGLAPLIGILRTALAAGHTGEIHLYHGSSTQAGLYLVDELRELARANPNFHYAPCVSSEPAAEGFLDGRAHDLAFAAHDSLAGWRVHLAGNPQMAAAAQALAAAAGAARDHILADPFVSDAAGSIESSASENCNFTTESDRRQFPPDPEMWAALKDGELMLEILTDFYTRVFDDPVLSPYFHDVTKQRLIEKVYSFLRQIFTGERRYFGNRPRNAHHWMVIPDEVFDYREALMTRIMREHGLAEPFVERWNAIEEAFRGDIVKSQPFGRVVDGIELPVEGFGRTVIEVGAVCDSCQQILEPGEEVLYHLRLGHLYCGDCR